MRFLRPDLLSWWLVIPVLIASCGLHWRLTRAFRRSAVSVFTINAADLEQAEVGEKTTIVSQIAENSMK